MHVFGRRLSLTALALAAGISLLVSSPGAAVAATSAAQSAEGDSSSTVSSAPGTSPIPPDDTKGSGRTNVVTPRCVVCGAPVKKAVKVSGPVLVQKKFVEYLTGAWARSTGYSWREGTTVTSSISSGLGVSAGVASSNLGVSSSVTKTYGVTVNISANSSKYSKLGLASNFNRYAVKSTWFQNGKVVPGSTWTYGDLYSPTKDQFLVVYYR